MRAEAEADAAGNLLARLPGRGERSILLCAHLDTVDDGGVPIEPVIVDGGWENANDGILGADNKAAVAVILELARRCSVEGSPVGVELLFTDRRGERARGDQGVRRRAGCSPTSATSSTTRRRSARSSPPRRPTTGSPPTSTAAPPTPASAPRRAAPRSSPPRWRSARMPHGRIDAQTTANVGLDPGRGGEHEHRARALPHRRRDPLARREPRRGRGGRHRRRHPRRRRARPSATSTSSPSGCSPATSRSRARPRWWRPRRRCAPAATSRGGSSPAAGRTPTCSRPAASRV